MSEAEEFDFAGMAELTPEDATRREEVRMAAFRRLFTSPVGRLVLADILTMAGVGQPMGLQPPGGNREYAAGMHDLALMILDLARFEQADLVANLTDGRKGYFHDRADFDD